MTSEALAKLVNKQMQEGVNPNLSVFEPGIRNEDNWWYVPVYNAGEGGTAREFVRQLSQAEEKIEKDCEKENLRLLLYPAVREEAET